MKYKEKPIFEEVKESKTKGPASLIWNINIIDSPEKKSFALGTLSEDFKPRLETRIKKLKQICNLSFLGCNNIPNLNFKFEILVLNSKTIFSGSAPVRATNKICFLIKSIGLWIPNLFYTNTSYFSS